MARASAYNNICLGLETSHDFPTLQKADEDLWSVTRELCTDIAASPISDLSSFRSGAFQKDVLRWFVLHPQTARLWSKPAGYSGDHITIQWLCENKPAWTALSDLFSNHVLRCTMAQQHREKVKEQQKFFSSYIAAGTKDIEIADFGCGPSIALRTALALCGSTCARVVLVDLDPSALNCSRQHLDEYSVDMQIEYSCNDVVQGLRKLARDKRRFDAIAFGGLFDYLPDRVVGFVLHKGLSLLKDGGSLFFSQVSRFNPDAIFMDWFGDWRLIQRDEEDILRLCQEASIDSTRVELWREPTNCALLAKIRPS
jgi:SAM-dependent methyltransferase